MTCNSPRGAFGSRVLDVAKAIGIHCIGKKGICNMEFTARITPPPAQMHCEVPAARIPEDRQ
jgi:hypothetical protein